MPRRFLSAHAVRAAVALMAVLVLGAGCSQKKPVEAPDLPAVSVEGRYLRWSTDTDARVVVRYGFDASRLDHLAYPEAADRRDRVFERNHEVALLDLEEEATVYYQIGVETRLYPDTRFSSVESFVSQVGPAPGQLTSTMVHIGFGDCHVLTMPSNGKQVLIDAGGTGADTAVRQYLSSIGVATFDYMLATHVHLDHLGGIIGGDQDGLLTSHTPLVFYDSERKDEGSGKWAYGQLQQMLDTGALTPTIIHRFDSSANVTALQWDPEVAVEVLNSGTPDDYIPDGYEGTDINNESIVLRISYGDVDMVIGGDAEREAEASMAEAYEGRELDTEFYKASHHGLSDASSAQWVARLNPRVSFIPNTAYSWDGDLDGALSQTMGTLSSVGAHAFAIDDVPLLGDRRTDGVQHNVTFATDGVSYEVRVEVAQQTPPAKTASTAACIHDDPDLLEFLDPFSDSHGSHQE